MATVNFVNNTEQQSSAPPRRNLKMRGAALVLSGLLAAGAFAAAPQSAGAASNPTIVLPDSLTWAPAAGLPPGAEVAVLYGNPTKTGPFAIRFKFPAGYEIAPHSHSTDELLTVISGKARMAFGENADAGSAQAVPAGAFIFLPASAWHRLFIDADTIVELHSTGPFDVKLRAQ